VVAPLDHPFVEAHGHPRIGVDLESGRERFPALGTVRRQHGCSCGLHASRIGDCPNPLNGRIESSERGPRWVDTSRGPRSLEASEDPGTRRGLVPRFFPAAIDAPG